MSDHKTPEKDGKGKASDPAELLKSLISSQPDGAAKQPVEPPRKSPKQPVEPPRKSTKQLSAAPDVVAKKQPTDQAKQRLDIPNSQAKKRQISWPMGDKLSLYSLVVGILSLVVAIIALPQFASVRPLFRPILAYSSSTGIFCPGGLVLPQSIDPLNLTPEAINLIKSAGENRDKSFLPPIGQWGYIHSVISNTANDNTQITIDGAVSLSVKRTDIPETINVISYGGCGAGYLESINYYGILLSIASSTSNRVINHQNKKDIYFPLQAGETEPFNFYFKCQDSGEYAITIEVKYSYNAETYTAKIADNHIIICPRKFMRWDVYSTPAWESGVIPKYGWLAGLVNSLEIHSDSNKKSKVIAIIHDQKEVELLGDYVAADDEIWAHIKLKANGAEGWAISE